MKMKCTNCFFHDENINPKNKGICHRYPPKHSFGNQDGLTLVEDYYWCGEFLKKVKK